MEEIFHVLALWARVILYPTTSYTLILLAISKKGTAAHRELYAYLTMAVLFITLWIGLIAQRVFEVEGHVIRTFFDFTVTPLLVAITIFSLYSMKTQAVNSVKKIETKLREVSNGNSIVS